MKKKRNSRGKNNEKKINTANMETVVSKITCSGNDPFNFYEFVCVRPLTYLHSFIIVFFSGVF